MTNVALLVEMRAKPGKEEDLANFLAGAQPLAVAEPDTLTWFALRLDVERFAIFDTSRKSTARRRRDQARSAFLVTWPLQRRASGIQRTPHGAR